MPEMYTPSGSSRDYEVPAYADVRDGPRDFKQFADSVDLLFDDTDTAIALKANLLATINAKTNDYTLGAGDSGEVITMDKATANTLTIPAGLPAGFTGTVIQKGAGQTTISAPGTPLATPGLKLRAQGSWATFIHLGSDLYAITGDLSA